MYRLAVEPKKGARAPKASRPQKFFVKMLAFRKLYVGMMVKSPVGFVKKFWRQLPPMYANMYPKVSMMI
jgi:hypothetical protein